jgi:hypothetical protein
LTLQSLTNSLPLLLDTETNLPSLVICNVSIREPNTWVVESPQPINRSTIDTCMAGLGLFAGSIALWRLSQAESEISEGAMSLAHAPALTAPAPQIRVVIIGSGIGTFGPPQNFSVVFFRWSVLSHFTSK